MTVTHLSHKTIAYNITVYSYPEIYVKFSLWFPKILGVKVPPLTLLPGKIFWKMT